MDNNANAKTPSSSPVKRAATATMLSDEEKKKIVKKKEKSIKAFVEFQETLVKEEKPMRLPKAIESSPFNQKPHYFLNSIRIKKKDTDEDKARKKHVQRELVRKLKVEFPNCHKEIERIPWFSSINQDKINGIDKFVKFQKTLLDEDKQMRLPNQKETSPYQFLRKIKIKDNDTIDDKAKKEVIQHELKRQLTVEFPDRHKEIDRIPWFSLITGATLNAIDDVIAFLRQVYDTKKKLLSPRRHNNPNENKFLQRLKTNENADKIYDEIMRQAKIEFDDELQDGVVKEEEISLAIRLESKNDDTCIHSEQIRKLANMCYQLRSEDKQMDKDTAGFCKAYFEFYAAMITIPQYLKKMLRRLYWKDEAEDPDGLKRQKEKGGAYFNDFLDKYGNGQKPLWDILHEELDITKLEKHIFPAEFHQLLGKPSAYIEAYVEQSLIPTVKFKKKQKAYLIQVLNLNCGVSTFNAFMLQKESELKQGTNLVATIQIKKDDTEEIVDAMETMELTVSDENPEVEEVVIIKAEAATQKGKEVEKNKNKKRQD
jgi:hypothetical protein